MTPLDRAVDADLAAYRHGPATLTDRLSSLTREQLEEHYTAHLARTETRAGLRAYYAAQRVQIAELQDERRQQRRGGNR